MDAGAEAVMGRPLLARRMPDARADGAGDWMPVSGNTGARRFPIRFTPGSRRQRIKR